MKKTIKTGFTIVLLFIAGTVFAQQQITVTIKGKPNEKITLKGYDNFLDDEIFNLKEYYAPPFNNASLDSKGAFTITANAAHPIWFMLQVNGEEKRIFCVLQKNRTYHFDISADKFTASCNIENKYFANEVSLMNQFNDILTFGLYVNFNVKSKKIDPLDSAFGSLPIQLASLPFFKSESTAESFYSEIQKVYTKKMSLLEKAYQADEISAFAYHYFKKQTLFNKLANSIIYLSPKESKSGFVISEHLKDSLLAVIENELNCKECVAVDSYSDMLNRYIDIKHSSGYDWLDYRKHTALYDFVAASQLPEHAKNLALLKAISSDILPKANQILYQQYVQKFKKDCTNQEYISAVHKKENEYSSASLLSIISSLKSYADKSTTLQEVIKKHKGKYIYLNYTYGFDINRIKECKQLEEKVKGKAVIIHLYFNEIENSWKKSVDDNDLDTDKCFFVTKRSKDEFFNKIRNYGLSVFVLIDRNGNIISSNAIDVSEALKTNYFDSLR